MRINNTQNCNVFGKLYVKPNEFTGFDKRLLQQCEGLLSKTQHVDVFIVSPYCVAIKNKKTDILQRIRSFYLYPQENTVGVEVDSVEGFYNYKVKYDSQVEAKNIWRDLCESSKTNNLLCYTNFALWLEKSFFTKKEEH